MPPPPPQEGCRHGFPSGLQGVLQSDNSLTGCRLRTPCSRGSAVTTGGTGGLPTRGRSHADQLAAGLASGNALVRKLRRHGGWHGWLAHPWPAHADQLAAGLASGNALVRKLRRHGGGGASKTVRSQAGAWDREECHELAPWIVTLVATPGDPATERPSGRVSIAGGGSRGRNGPQSAFVFNDEGSRLGRPCSLPQLR
jgi:hypothetical protein